jgi:hypothetical protein
MRIIAILCLLGLQAPIAHAYPESPPFEQTQFSEDFGVFRWWRSCWWRVFDPNVYLIFQPDGEVLLLYPDGTVRVATEEGLARLYVSGDGFCLSDVYGGTFTRFGGSSTSGGPNGFGGFRGYGDSSRTGVFSFDGSGNPIDRDSNDFRFGGEDTDRSDAGWRFGGDGSGGRFASTRMDDFFYEPLGLVGCDSIYDSKDGGVLGPIPCTSYPNVFGDVPKY